MAEPMQTVEGSLWRLRVRGSLVPAACADALGAAASVSDGAGSLGNGAAMRVWTVAGHLADPGRRR
ncbi:hypothetical protein [Glycomyces arizonensis]|uniref:hypothetical protein n=1 Tax=Glycomyces arizonensis TaxID=256035 RepID=UPI00040FEE34|nr:hypothetical protein [Glycomyces arizonensis]